MADAGFHRDPDTIRKSMVMATSRLTAAVQNRNDALAAAAKADDDVLTYERHIELCRKSINGLLDEWNAAMNAAIEAKVDA